MNGQLWLYKHLVIMMFERLSYLHLLHKIWVLRMVTFILSQHFCVIFMGRSRAKSKLYGHNQNGLLYVGSLLKKSEQTNPLTKGLNGAGKVSLQWSLQGSIFKCLRSCDPGRVFILKAEVI